MSSIELKEFDFNVKLEWMENFAQVEKTVTSSVVFILDNDNAFKNMDCLKPILETFHTLYENKDLERGNYQFLFTINKLKIQ